jgi:hypothetical protein
MQNCEFGKCDYLNGVHIFIHVRVGAGVSIKIKKKIILLEVFSTLKSPVKNAKVIAVESLR